MRGTNSSMRSFEDAAYQSLLKKPPARMWHAQIARTIEARFPEIAGSQPELVARHFTEAGLPDLAIPLWQRAAERAALTSANAEAVAHLRQAIALVAGLPADENRAQVELHLQTLLASLLIAT